MEEFFQYLKNRLINDFQFNEIDLNQQYDFWIEKNGNDLKANSAFYWSCLNFAFKYYSKNYTSSEDRYQQLRSISLLMFDFLLKENRKVTRIQKQINLIDMNRANEHDYEVEVIISPGNRCQYAKEFEGIKVPLTQALINFPIDYSKCDRKGGCVCGVGFQGKMDSNNMLIRKNNTTNSP